MAHEPSARAEEADASNSMPTQPARRAFLGGVAALACAPWLVSGSAAAEAKTRLILLGTAGGPRPRQTRAGSAQVIVAGDALYVVDCGDGVARQIVAAGLPL